MRIRLSRQGLRKNLYQEGTVFVSWYAEALLGCAPDITPKELTHQEYCLVDWQRHNACGRYLSNTDEEPPTRRSYRRGSLRKDQVWNVRKSSHRIENRKNLKSSPPYSNSVPQWASWAFFLLWDPVNATWSGTSLMTSYHVNVNVWTITIKHWSFCKLRT